MTDSTQISGISPSGGSAVQKSRKGRQKNALGVFSKLLSGLLGKPHAAHGRFGHKTDGAAAPSMETPSQSVNKTKQHFAALQRGEPAKKNGKEELVAPPSGRKPEKSGKKTGNEELVPDTPPLNVQNRERFVSDADRQEAGTVQPGEKLSEPELPAVSARNRAENLESARFLPENARAVPAFENQEKSRILRDETPRGEIRREEIRRTRRKEKPFVEVQDLRGGQAPEQVRTAQGFVERDAVIDLQSADDKLFSGARNGPEKNLPHESGPSFESLLAGRLSEDLSASIVKQAAFVLRDGGEGTIRLSLKPETLGKVKIHLEMAENKVSGRIVVESEDALKAFEREIRTLEQAFRDSGFGEASLETALDSGNGREWKGDESPFYSERLAAAGYDAGSEWTGTDAEPWNGSFFSVVNMLV
jgi:flagellar hook-length control protein FliK